MLNPLTPAAAKLLQSCPTLCDPIDGSPPRLPHPWDSPGKNTGVGCHFLLQCLKVKSESESEVVSDSWRPHELQPTRLLHPWDFPGKSTGVGCHCLLRLTPGKDWKQEEKGTTEDKMAGWHQRLKRHEFEQVLEVGDGQGTVVCCSPWGCKESDLTEWLNWTDS